MIPAKNIFIIDDDQLFIFLVKKSIQETGLVAHTKEFSDGQAAINQIKEFEGKTDMLPDFIFLDLSMPIMDGWEFLKNYALLEQNFEKKARLYIFSTAISPHDKERARSITTVADFIIKPLKKETMMEILTS